MILLTGGFPYSGKTKFAETLLDIVDNKWAIHIDPKKYLPDDFDTMYEGDRMMWMTSAWSIGYEKAEEAIKKLPNKALIIFDTTASKISSIKPLIKSAKENDHKIIYVLVHAQLEDRIERTNDVNKLIELEKNYTYNLRTSIPIIKKMSDKFILIKNINGDPGQQAIRQGADKIALYIKIIRSQ